MNIELNAKSASKWYTHRVTTWYLSMNNSLIALLIGAVVVVGGGYWYISQPGDEAMMEGEHMMAENENALTASTFAQILARGQAVTCTFEHNDGVNVSSGTVYIADGAERMRGDFVISQSAGGPMEAHLIRDGGYNYLWGSAFPQGIKTEVTAENRNKLFDDENNSAVDENTEYSCVAWNVDGSKFALPGDVTFTDMSAQMGAMQDAQNSMGDMQAMQCAACDQAGSGRDQCRMALGCE